MPIAAQASEAGPSLLARLAPGLAALRSYERTDFAHDLVAGVSVAAVALPVGVAYAQLAGFNPAVGLYASILPLVAYALFGTSRQLIVGPDAATCALVASAVAPLAAGDPQLYLSLSVSLAFLAGVLCIGARFLKLGAIADFLSKPILVGFLNGIALSIVLGQIGKIFGFPIQAGGIVPRLFEFFSKLEQTHLTTLAVGAGTFAVIFVSPRLLRRMPAAFVAMAIAAGVTKFLGLEAYGVKTVGLVPAGLPPLRFPAFDLGLLPQLLGDAAGLALVSFSSMMLTSRSFASKNGYEVDTDREFAALGAANIAAALSQGFAVSGADSRTAMSDATGGRTQVTGLVTAATIAAVLLFFTGPLQYVPIAALGAVLVKAAFSLVDFATLRRLLKIDRQEFVLSLLATLGVVGVGAIPAILFAVVLATLRFVKLTSRPSVELLGEVPDLPGFHSLQRHPEARTIPGLRLFRFNAPIVFFNAPYFKREAIAAATAGAPGAKWFVIDLIPVPLIDATGLYAVDEVNKALRAAGIRFVGAGRRTEWREWAEKRGLTPQSGEVTMFPSIEEAIRAFQAQSGREACA